MSPGVPRPRWEDPFRALDMLGAPRRRRLTAAAPVSAHRLYAR
jgi:hypothetical protein